MEEDDDGMFMLDVVIFVIVLLVCGREREIRVGKGVYGLVMKLSLDKEVVVINVLMDMYFKCGCINDV